MGKIFFLSGKSSTGKDTIFALLLKHKELKLKTIVLYTTRPMRDGEENGREYFFVDDKSAALHEKDGSIIEMRVYNTVHGPWKYYTRNDNQIDLKSEENYLVIGTIEAFEMYCKYYGKDNVVPIYIEIDDGERLQRALDRERHQENPQYREMCRRFIADDDDFSEKNLERNGIKRRFYNDDINRCINEIVEFIMSNKN